MDNVRSLKDKRNQRKLNKAKDDIEKLLFFCTKMLPALMRYQQYTGVRPMVEKIKEAQIILTIHKRQIDKALGGMSGTAHPGT